MDPKFVKASEVESLPVEERSDAVFVREIVSYIIQKVEERSVDHHVILSLITKIGVTLLSNIGLMEIQYRMNQAFVDKLLSAPIAKGTKEN